MGLTALVGMPRRPVYVVRMCSAAIKHEDFFGRELDDELDTHCLNWLRDLHRVSIDELGVESIWPLPLRTAMYLSVPSLACSHVGVYNRLAVRYRVAGGIDVGVVHECLLTANGDAAVAAAMLEEIGANQFGNEYSRKCIESAEKIGMDAELAQTMASEKRLGIFRRFPLKPGEEIDEHFLRHNHDIDAVMEDMTRFQLGILGWLGGKMPEDVTCELLLNAPWADLEDVKWALGGTSFIRVDVLADTL